MSENDAAGLMSEGDALALKGADVDVKDENAKPYPLIQTPAFKDYLWGGTRLVDEFGKTAERTPVAESWELSCHPDGPSHVANGTLSGLSLPEALSRFPRWVGSRVWKRDTMTADEAADAFPILIKLIDAREDLSLQVHPNDEYAKTREGSRGKNELWYVIDCDPGSHLALGLSKPLPPELAAAAGGGRNAVRDAMLAVMRQGRVMSLSRYVEARPGDCFPIRAGLLHAIGAGMLISEIQQNSNITYRVDDYGRLGADGKPRPLHVEQAADVVDVTLDAVNVGRAREGTSDRVDDTGSAILRRTDAAGAANGTDAAGAADGTDGADAADGTDAAGAADSANWTDGADATNAAGAADATDGGNTVRTDNAEAVTLTDWPYFRARMVTVGADENGIARFHAGSESFHAILALDDGLELHYNDGMESVGVARGQTVFVPAGMGLYELRPAADLLSYSDLDEVPVCALPPRESPSGANHSAADAAHSDSRPYSQSVAQRGAPLSGASAPFRAVRALLTDIIRDAL